MALLCCRAGATAHLGRPHLGRFDLVRPSVRVDRFDSGADRLITARHLDHLSRFRRVAVVGEGTVEPEGLEQNDPGLRRVGHQADRTARTAAWSTWRVGASARIEGMPARLPNYIRREEPVTHCAGCASVPRSGLLALSVDLDGGNVRPTARVYVGNARAKELACDVLPDPDDVARVRERSKHVCRTHRSRDHRLGRSRRGVA